MKSTRFTSIMIFFTVVLVLGLSGGCTTQDIEIEKTAKTPEARYFLKRDQTHNKFSKTIPPVLRVPSGAVIEAETEEAADKQLTPDSKVDILA